MLRLNKVYSNLMVDLKATNKKLIKRACFLVEKITGCDEKTATEALKKSGYKVKDAALIITNGISPEEAKEILKRNQGNLREALKD